MDVVGGTANKVITVIVGVTHRTTPNNSSKVGTRDRTETTRESTCQTTRVTGMQRKREVLKDRGLEK